MLLLLNCQHWGAAHRQYCAGAFGDVWMATMIQGDGQNHAIKVLDKAHIAQTDTLSNVLEEKKVLKMCHDPTPTPFIVQLKYAFQDEKKLYLVLSLVEGGDLYTNLDKQPSKSTTEQEQ